MHETGEMKYLLRGKKRINRFSSIVFREVQNEFTNTFGVDNRFAKYLDKVWELELIKINIALTGDRSEKIFADVLEIEINDLLSEKEQEVLNHGVMYIEKFMGFKLNVKETTVSEFYSYAKEIEKTVKDGIR